MRLLVNIDVFVHIDSGWNAILQFCTVLIYWVGHTLVRFPDWQVGRGNGQVEDALAGITKIPFNLFALHQCCDKVSPTISRQTGGTQMESEMHQSVLGWTCLALLASLPTLPSLRYFFLHLHLKNQPPYQATAVTKYPEVNSRTGRRNANPSSVRHTDSNFPHLHLFWHHFTTWLMTKSLNIKIIISKANIQKQIDNTRRR